MIGLKTRRSHPRCRLILIPALLCCLCVGEVSAQYIERGTLTARLETASRPIQSESEYNISGDSTTTPPLVVELGYILAMETAFLGLSFLGSRDNKWGPPVVGGSDIFMALAGISTPETGPIDIQQLGYYAVSAGFLLKALYNFGGLGTPNEKQRFQVNFLSYNLLVFTGYYLDTLG